MGAEPFIPEPWIDEASKSISNAAGGFIPPLYPISGPEAGTGLVLRRPWHKKLRYRLRVRMYDLREDLALRIAPWLERFPPDD